MADPPAYPETGKDTSEGPDREPTTGMPRWVKVGIIALVVLVLLVVALALAGVHDPRPGPGHGP
jgi:hypothetical protein